MVKGDSVHSHRHTSWYSVVLLLSLSVSRMSHDVLVSFCQPSIQSPPKFLPSPPHIPAVLPSFRALTLFAQVHYYITSSTFFSSLPPLGLPVFQVFPPLITPTCIIKFRRFLKRSGGGGGWDYFNLDKRLDYFNLMSWKIQIFIIFFFHLCHPNNHTPPYIISKCDKKLGWGGP